MTFLRGLKSDVGRGVQAGFPDAKASLLRETLAGRAKDIFLCLPEALKEAAMRNLVTDFGY